VDTLPTEVVRQAFHALLLSREGALDAELAGVDVAHELHRYGELQL
jgi:hypothetical protein